MWYSNIKETAKHRETVERVASVPLARRLAAAGLSRLYDHMMRGPFAVISGGRDKYDEAENVRRSKQLREHLRSLGYGYADTRGIWSEDKGAEKSVFKSEPSYFIPGISQEDADAIGRKFEQQFVLFGNGGKYTFLPTDPDKPDAVSAPESEWNDLGNAFHQIRQDKNEPPENATQIGHKQFTLRNKPAPPTQTAPPDYVDVPLSRLSTASERHSDNCVYYALTERRAAGSGTHGIGSLGQGIPFHSDDPNCNEMLVYIPFRRAYLEYDLTRLAQAAGEPTVVTDDNGAGFSVDINHPPSDQQLRAMEDAYYSTSGKKFIAELYDGLKLVGHAQSPAELYRVLDLAKSGKTARAIAAASQGMFFVRFADDLETTTGKRIA